MSWNEVITVGVRYICIQDARAIIWHRTQATGVSSVPRRPPQSPSLQTSLGVVQTAVTLHQDSPGPVAFPPLAAVWCL